MSWIFFDALIVRSIIDPPPKKSATFDVRRFLQAGSSFRPLIVLAVVNRVAVRLGSRVAFSPASMPIHTSAQPAAMGSPGTPLRKRFRTQKYHCFFHATRSILSRLTLMSHIRLFMVLGLYAG